MGLDLPLSQIPRFYCTFTIDSVQPWLRDLEVCLHLLFGTMKNKNYFLLGIPLE